MNYLKGKMITCGGGQTVVMSDVDKIRPRALKHSHINPAEVHPIIESFVLGDIGYGKIWKSLSHITADNFFLSDSILDWMGEQGLGMIGTMAKNRLPSGVLFDKKNAARDSNARGRAKASRFASKLIMLVKTMEADPKKGTKACRRVHCSFQSTGHSNLGSVNSVPHPSISAFTNRKEGKELTKGGCALK